MNMIQFQPVEALDGILRDTGFHAVVGPEFGLRADVSPGDADIVSQQSPVDLDVLAGALVAEFRAHSHVSNVMTHISGARWDHIEHALHVILDSTAPVDLSRLEANIVDLICAERGVTGRIFKPFFETLLARLLPPTPAARLQARVWSLHQAMAVSADANAGSAGSACATGAVR